MPTLKETLIHHGCILHTNQFELFLFYIRCFIKMKRKSRSDDLFGGASAFSGSQLFTYSDVALSCKVRVLERLSKIEKSRKK